MTESEFYQNLLDELEQAAHQDKQLANLLEKIQSGKADFEGASAYWQKFSELAGKILKQNAVEAGSGLNESAGFQLMQDSQERAYQIYSMVQKALDRKQNLHLNPVSPKFPEERARQAAHSLEDLTVTQEVIRRRAENAVSNIINSFGDDYIQENANFRKKAGLSCHVSRIGALKCCAWCAKLAGRYEVGSEPADFWKKHDKCTCRIIYETQKFRQRLSGNGNGWKVDSEVQRRRAQAIQYKPAVLTPEQAQALEQQNLSQYRGLTITGKTGIISSRSSGNSNIISDNHTFEKIGQIDFSDKKGISVLLAQFEKKYADSNIEHCIVFTTNGEIYEVHGDSYRVNTGLLGAKMKGSINEHNHVTGESEYSFSWEDLESCTEDGTSTAIAYDEKYRYFMIFPDKKLSEDTVYEAYENAKESVNFDMKYHPEQVPEGDEQHERIKRACEQLGIKYARSRLSR